MATSYFSGRVHSVVFENEHEAFYILRVVLDQESITSEIPVGSHTITVKGEIPGLQIGVGLWFGFEGVWDDHSVHGKQVRITRAPVLKDGWDKDTCCKILLSQGVGANLVQSIKDHFGERMGNALLDLEEVSQVPGMTEFLAGFVRDKWASARAHFLTLGFLGDLGLPQGKVKQVWAIFGDNAKEILSQNPWALVQIPGITFNDADTVAARLSLDCSHNNPLRIEGAVLYAAREGRGFGHLYSRTGELLQVVRGIDPFITEKDLALAIRSMVKQDSLVVDRDPTTGVTGIYDPWLYKVEKDSASMLMQRRVGAVIKPDLSARYAKSLVPEEACTLREAVLRTLARNSAAGGMKLSAKQTEGVINALVDPVSILTGLPGSGKTSSLRTAVSIMQEAGMSILMVAPTGIAAKRLASVTGSNASTIHRAFRSQGAKDQGREANYSGVVGECQTLTGSDGADEVWGFGPGDPHPAEVVLVDECFYWKQPVLTENGWEHIGKIVEQQLPVRVWARNPDTGVLELKPIVRYLKHPYPGDLIRVSVGETQSTRGARVIRCTREHKILTPSGYVKAGDLKEGDLVIVRGTTLTKEQMSVLVGSILGDGSMCNNSGRNSPQPSFCQGEDQKEYLLFKHAIFGPLASPVTTSKSGYGDRNVHRFILRMCEESRHIYSDIMSDGHHASGRTRWAPTPEFMGRVDEQALATWFIDNGSTHSRETKSGVSLYATLHTQRFSRETHGFLVNWFSRRFDLHPKIGHDRKKDLYWLRFSKSETQKLFDIIRPFVPVCMSRKVPGGNYVHAPGPRVDTTASFVGSVSEFKPKRTYKFVYDLEVQDHHNYVAGNIVVSNCSMVDQHLLYRILECTRKDARLVFVGDAAQLPSVGPGNVLRDLIDSGLFPTVTLTEVFRQAETSPIIRAAHDVHAGRVPQAPMGTDFSLISMEDEGKVATTIVAMAKKLFDARSNFQVLSPRHSGTVGVTSLNTRLREAINPKQPTLQEIKLGSEILREDDRVMVVKNEYNLGIYNGDVGKIVSIDRKAKEIEVKIHGPPVMHVRIPFKSAGHLLRLAYVITAHRSQGQEYDVILLPILPSFGLQLQRKLFYTAITRARKKVILLGSASAMATAVANDREGDRNTMFRHRLLRLVSDTTSDTGKS